MTPSQLAHFSSHASFQVSALGGSPLMMKFCSRMWGFFGIPEKSLQGNRRKEGGPQTDHNKWGSVTHLKGYL